MTLGGLDDLDQTIRCMLQEDARKTSSSDIAAVLTAVDATEVTVDPAASREPGLLRRLAERLFF